MSRKKRRMRAQQIIMSIIGVLIILAMILSLVRF
jgi:predicted nucleic acid-binding Zn ribbon protein